MKNLIVLTFFIFFISSLAKGSVHTVEKDIRKLKKMKKKHSRILAKIIYKNSKKYKVDHKIIIALLKIESNFEQKASNKNGCKYIGFRKKCGDFSIAQINFLIWKEEFRRIGIRLDLVSLKSSNAYAIEKMAHILAILKKRHSKKDPLWFVRYNSNNILKRLRYLKMIEYPLKRIKYAFNYKHKEKVLYYAVKKHGWKKVMGIFTHMPSAVLKI